MLGIGYVDVRRIPCSCSEFLKKLALPWNISQDKYNQVRYKGENHNCVYWPFLWSYKNWHIIHFIERIKQQELIEADINVHI